MECDAAENYIYCNRSKWLVCNVGKLPRIVNFYTFLTGARLNNHIPDNVMGLKILKWKCACGSSFVRIFGSHFP